MVNPHIFFIKKDNISWQVNIQGQELWFCFSNDKGKVWTELQLVTSEYQDFFTFAITKDEILKIVFLNSRGDIEYCSICRTDVTKNYIEKKWLEKEHLTFLSLLDKGEGKEHLILITSSPEGNLKRIKHSQKNKEGWNCPKQIDYLVGLEELSMSVILEDDGKIFLAYSFKGNFFYKEWHPLLNCWSEKTKPFSVEDNIEQINLINDAKGTIFLIWISRYEKKSRVKVKKKIRGGWPIGGWQKEIIIHEGDYCRNPILLIKQAKVIVGWETAEGYYTSLSKDGGLTFEEAKKVAIKEEMINNNNIFLDISSGNNINIAGNMGNFFTDIFSFLGVFGDNKEKESSFAEIVLDDEEKDNEVNILEELKKNISVKEEELRKIKKRENELLQINKKLREKIKKYIKKDKQG